MSTNNFKTKEMYINVIEENEIAKNSFFKFHKFLQQHNSFQQFFIHFCLARSYYDVHYGKLVFFVNSFDTSYFTMHI